jgi:predicted 2-oxoglutarate/Fe(II)-dependent dioxygenase YbiX/peroxiredoxin
MGLALGEAALRPLGRLEAGDRAPVINTVDDRGQPVSTQADFIAGRPIALLFAALGHPSLAATLGDLSGAYTELSGTATVFAVIGGSAEQVNAAAARWRLPFSVLVDASGGVFDAYGIEAGALVAVVLDPAHRVVRVMGAGATLAAEVRACVRDINPDGPPQRLAAQAPVLVLPRALSPEDCASLIEAWHRPVGVWPSDGFTSPGYQREAGDFKVAHAGAYGHMNEYVVREPALQRFLDERLGRRLGPELQKAFQTKVSRREDYRISCYEADEGGVLAPHRDNPTAQTAHRRFTMTVNLNAGAYDGGELRFREYGEQLYAVERGTAVVWSASLLHEVLPVTRGRRFILGAHMFGT